MPDLKTINAGIARNTGGEDPITLSWRKSALTAAGKDAYCD
jgi:hypothetical protein